MKIFGAIISLASGIFAFFYAIKNPEVVDPDKFANWAEYVAFTAVFMSIGAGTLFREFFGCPGDIEDSRR